MSTKIDIVLLDTLVNHLPSELAGPAVQRLSEMHAHRHDLESQLYFERGVISELRTRNDITSQDRDARRVRMELAQFILDYENTYDWSPFWGVVSTGTHTIITVEELNHLRAAQSALNEEVFRRNQEHSEVRPVVVPRVFGAPTGIDAPTRPVPQPFESVTVCGEEYALIDDPRDASHFATCTLDQGHAGQHARRGQTITPAHSKGCAIFSGGCCDCGFKYEDGVRS